MAVETVYGSLNVDGYENSFPPEAMDGALQGGRVRCIVETVEVAAAASVGSKYYFGKIPSNAVILPGSKLYWDDLHAGAGVPTIDLGIDGSVTTADPDAISNGNDATAAGSVELLPADKANYGKKVWELGGVETVDPNELVDIYASIADVDADTGGTVTVVIFYAAK